MNPDPTEVLSQTLTAGLKSYFRKKFPFREERSFPPDEWEALGRKYKRAKVATSIIAMLQFFGMPVVSGWLFYRLYLLIGHGMASAPNVFHPATWTMFIIPGFFFGLATINTVSTLLQMFLFGASYRDLEYYHNIKEGYDNDSSFRFISKILFVPFGITLLMAMTTMIVTSQDSYSYKSFTTLLPKRYNYTDVTKVIFYEGFLTNKKAINFSPHFVVFFKDGTRMPTNWYFDGIAETVPFIETLKRKGIASDSAVVDEN